MRRASHPRSPLPLAAVGLALALALAPRALADPPRTVVVAAAASLKPAADALARAFEARHAGVAVRVALGASGTLFAQLQAGAPFDVFLSADRDYPRRLVTAGLAAAADERTYAVGRLVVWLPPGSRVALGQRGLAALADPAVQRIAIANPAVAPYGRAAEAALAAAGVLDAVRARLVVGGSVAQVAQFASTGAVDAALLPRALALEPALAGGTVHALPPASYPRIEQSAVALSSARELALARAFVDFVAGPEGRAILARHGYDPP